MTIKKKGKADPKIAIKAPFIFPTFKTKKIISNNNPGKITKIVTVI